MSECKLPRPLTPADKEQEQRPHALKKAELLERPGSEARSGAQGVRIQEDGDWNDGLAEIR